MGSKNAVECVDDAREEKVGGLGNRGGFNQLMREIIERVEVGTDCKCSCDFFLLVHFIKIIRGTDL